MSIGKKYYNHNSRNNKRPVLTGPQQILQPQQPELQKKVFTGPMQQQQMGQITQQPQQLRAEQGIEEVAEQQKLDLI
jgi:hypothetical protein